MKNKKKLIVALLTLGMALPTWAARTYSLDDYLNEVKSKNTGFAAAIEQSLGAEGRADEGDVKLSPTAFATAEYDYDKRPTLAPLFQGDKTILQNYTLGVSKLTSFGLNGRIFYGLTRTRVLGASPSFLPLNDYYDARPQIEITQSLWKNFLGSETKANRDLKEAQALQVQYEQAFKAKQIAAEAETAYWRMAIAQSQVAVNKASLERAAGIRTWLEKQVNRQLSDRSDYLQAVAAVEIHELDLATSKDEARSASIAFNSYRNRASSEVSETLAPMDVAYFDNMNLPKRVETREDVMAAEQRTKAAVANAKIGRESLTPQLELYGTMALYGRNTQMGEAFSESNGTDHPYGIIGVRFSAPLDIATLIDARRGYAREQHGAELAYQRTKFEADREWDDLSQKFAETKKRLKLTQTILAAQKEKADHERERHRRGRSTTYQVLTFEQDYATAQLSKLAIQKELLALYAKLKTYAAETSESGARK